MADLAGFDWIDRFDSAAFVDCPDPDPASSLVQPGCLAGYSDRSDLAGSVDSGFDYCLVFAGYTDFAGSAQTGFAAHHILAHC